MLVLSHCNRNASFSVLSWVETLAAQLGLGEKSMSKQMVQTVSLTNSRGAVAALKVFSDSMQFTLKNVHFTVSVLLNHNTEFASKIVARCLAGAAPRGASASRAQFEARLSSRQAVQQFATH